MITASTATNSSITTISGFFAFAKAICGDNDSDIYGPPEVMIGKDSSNYYAEHREWNSGSTFATGSVAFSMAAPSGGSNVVTGSIKGAISYTGISVPNSISTVKIRAGVKRPAIVAWSDITVNFIPAGGGSADSYISAAGPSVNTSSSSPPIRKEQILTVSTDWNNVGSVEVTGTFEMSCATNMPNTEDLFIDVYLV